MEDISKKREQFKQGIGRFLQREERYRLKKLLTPENSFGDIAKILGRAKSTIIKHVNSRGGRFGYDPDLEVVCGNEGIYSLKRQRDDIQLITSKINSLESKIETITMQLEILIDIVTKNQTNNSQEEKKKNPW
jgi:IS30 family transposase